MIYVYTSILNGFDNLRPPACEIPDNVRFICYTNVPNLPRVTPWEYRTAYGFREASTSSRIPKILPHLMLPPDAEFSIYHDGNFQLRMDPNHVIDILSENRQWAAHKHPGRDCIYREAEIVIRDCPLVDKDSVVKQIVRYRENGFPEKFGLWANGFLVRRHTPEVARLNELWWEEFRDGSTRDQLSFPFALFHSGMEILTIEEDIFHSSFIKHNWHAAWKTKEDNPDFWQEREKIRAKLKDLRVITGTSGGIDFGITKDATGKRFEF